MEQEAERGIWSSSWGHGLGVSRRPKVPD
jgi:hypothetical protein